MEKTEETTWDHYDSITDAYQEYQKEKKGQRIGAR